MSEEITLRLVKSGEGEVQVDRADYDAAKAAGELDLFLDMHASDVEAHTVVVEPDGIEVDPDSWDGYAYIETKGGNWRAVLDCPMGENDADAETVGEYLAKLLAMVWEYGEGFDGKRPFGNSDWEYEVYTALGRAGLIDMTFDEDGYPERFDDQAAHKLVADAITAAMAANFNVAATSA